MTPDVGTVGIVVVVSSWTVDSVVVDGAVDGADEVEVVGSSRATVVLTSVPDCEHATDIVASMQIPNPVSFFRNWTRSDLTTDEKLRQAVKNTAIKARTGDACCGNHGEVGC